MPTNNMKIKKNSRGKNKKSAKDDQLDDVVSKDHDDSEKFTEEIKKNIKAAAKKLLDISGTDKVIDEYCIMDDKFMQAVMQENFPAVNLMSTICTLGRVASIDTWFDFENFSEKS